MRNKSIFHQKKSLLFGGILAVSTLCVDTIFGARFFLDPPQAKESVNCESAVRIMIDSEGEDIQSADALIHFNSNEIEIIDQNEEQEGVQVREGDIFDLYGGNEINYDESKIYLTGFNLFSLYQTGDHPDTYGIIYFRPKPNVSRTTFRFDYTSGSTIDSNIVRSDTVDRLSAVGNAEYEFFDWESCDGDIHPPVIQNVNPAAAQQNVPLYSDISFEVADERSGVDRASISINVNGKEYSESSEELTIQGSKEKYTVTLDPADNFPDGLPVYVTIKATDLDGNRTLPYEFSFNHQRSDEFPPRVEDPTPAPGDKGVALDANISFHLVDEISGVDINSVEVQIGEEVYLPGEGSLTYGGGQMDYLFVLDPETDFLEGTPVYVEVRGADLKGNRMEPFVFSFNHADTDTVPPFISETFPENNAQNVPLDTEIIFHVQDNLTGIDLESILALINGVPYKSADQEFSYTGDPNHYTVTINPAVPFAAGEEVVVEISASDNGGNQVIRYIFRFNRPARCGDDIVEQEEECEPPGTGTCSAECKIDDSVPPYIVIDEPLPGAQGVDLNTDVRFTIDDNLAGVDLESLEVEIAGQKYNSSQVYFSSQPQGNGFAVSIDPISALPAGETINVKISAADESGNTMEPFVYSFNHVEDDTFPPQIIPVAPMPGAIDVPLNSNIEFNLRDDISGVDLDTLKVTVNEDSYLSNNAGMSISGTLRDYAIVLKPTNKFPFKKEVVITIEISDYKGNQLEPYSYIINKLPEDKMAPHIETPSPHPGDEDVPLDTNISFTIKDNMVGVDLNTLQVKVGDLIYNQQDVRLTIQGDPLNYFVEIDPSHPFPPKEGIEVEITAADLNGNAMPPFMFYFNQLPDDTLPPYVQDIIPAPGSRNVPLNSGIQFYLRDDLVGVVQESVKVRIDNREQKELVFEGDEMQYLVTVDPDIDFLPKKEVKITIQAEDYVGNVMNPYRFTFNQPERDEAPPQITFPQPEPGAQEVPRNASVSFMISDDYSGVDLQSVEVLINNKFYNLSFNEFEYTGDEEKYQITITPEKKFKPAEEVVVQISAYDKFGNETEPYSYSFNKPPACGDGLIEAPEECEPPNTSSCDAQCFILPTEKTAPYIVEAYPANKARNIPTNTQISFRIKNHVSGVDIESVKVEINGQPYHSELQEFRYTGEEKDYLVTIDPQTALPENQVIEVKVNAQAIDGTVMNEFKFSFNKPPVCGDGIIETPEICEPPNSGNCNAQCQLADEAKSFPYVSATTPTNQAQEVALESHILFTLQDNTVGVDIESITARINGKNYYHANEEFVYLGEPNKYEIDITPRVALPEGKEVTVEIFAQNLDGAQMPPYSFAFNRPAVCGDGLIELHEECEPPGSASCSLECLAIEPEEPLLASAPKSVCGNNVVEEGETCEPPGVGMCDVDCSPREVDPQLLDSDQDGIPDQEEILEWGTDPFDPEPQPISTRIVNWKDGNVSAGEYLLVKGVSHKGAQVKVFAVSKNGSKIYLGEAITDKDNKYVLLSQVALESGLYVLTAEGYKKNGTLIEKSPSVQIEVDLTRDDANASITAFDSEAFMVGGVIQTTSTQPVISGYATPDSKVYVVFQSKTITALTFSDESGFYQVASPKKLESGKHKATMYAEKDGVMTPPTYVDFNILSPDQIEALEKEEICRDWWWLVVLLFLALLGTNVMWTKMYHDQKEEKKKKAQKLKKTKKAIPSRKKTKSTTKTKK